MDEQYNGATQGTTPTSRPQNYGDMDKCAIAREVTARELLGRRIDTLDIQLTQLRELYKALPLELPSRADRALRDLLQKS